MNGSRLINPNNDDIFDLIMGCSHLLKVSVNTINDLPKLIEAMETWNYFESATGIRHWLAYLKDKINEEMNATNAETA